MSRTRSSHDEPLFLIRDLTAIAKLGAGFVVSWSVPERYWFSVTSFIIRLIEIFRPRRKEAKAKLLEAVLAGHLSRDPNQILHDNAVLKYACRLQAFKIYHPKGYSPNIELIGREHIDAAREHGRGAVLWMGNFVAGNLIEPIALARADIPLYHLSNWLHGLSNSLFAAKFLNPIVIGAENRYLAGRIIRKPGSPKSLIEMRNRLQDNQVVGIRAHDGAAMVLELPFLSGRILLATGPLELAMLTRSVVLPVFAVGDGLAQFRLHIEAPIEISKTDDRKLAISNAALEYVRRLEGYVVAYPERWFGWDRQTLAVRSRDDQAVFEVPGVEHQIRIRRKT